MAEFTERELDVMSVLWRLTSGTVSQVRDELSEAFAYTTVLTVLRTLEAKGFVRHEEEGKAHRYYPTVAREDAATTGLWRLVDKVFAGSTDALLSHLVNDKRLSREKLKTLRALLDERLKSEARR